MQVVVRRGDELLVVHRSPEQDAYWHVIAGGVEDYDESDAAAARRELAEETGLDADPGAALHEYDYPLAEEPHRLPQFPPGTESIHVSCFLVEAPPGWEPRLDAEHDDHRWCTGDEARRLLRWADAAAALTRLAAQ